MTATMRAGRMRSAWAVVLGMLLWVGAGLPQAWASVSVTLTAPANGALFTAPANITLTATATAGQGYTVSKVEFFQGTTLIGTDTTSPYSFNWNNVAAGSYAVTAKATAIKKNQANQTATSAVANITVNALPTVSLTSPANNAVFAAPANITVSADAADSDGTVSKVEFFQGATLIGTVTSAPYTFNWTNVAAGPYTLTAKATDNQNAATTSAPVNITVDTAPTVSLTSPANNAVFTAPANITVTASAADSDGTIQKVDFFQGATLIGTATTTPYSVNWANVASGAYTLTAVATDNLGITTTSSPVAINVDTAPTVSLTSPANNAVFTAPANVTLTATAADSDGSIQKVDFYRGGSTLIATATSAPYTFNWTNVQAGPYTLTAVATDNLGVTTTSDPVAITVNQGIAQLYFIHTDHLNTPRLISNTVGQTVWTWNNDDPFGNNAPNENPSGLGNFTCNLRLPGQYFDKESNTHYNYFRDYDPAIGRYIQSDPIGLAGGINTYDYTDGNPMSRRDPLGLWSTAAHNYFIDQTFGGISASNLNSIKFGSALADDPRYQSADYAYMHAMSSSSLSKEQALEKYCRFIEEKMKLYRENVGRKRMQPLAYRALGMAMHAVMDSTSPAHAGFQRWDGGILDPGNHGPSWFNPNTIEDINAAPAYLDVTRSRMNNVLNGQLPPECRCR